MDVLEFEKGVSWVRKEKIRPKPGFEDCWKWIVLYLRFGNGRGILKYRGLSLHGE